MINVENASRSVSNSLSASGRKRVIKRVVIKKVRQPSPTRSDSVPAPRDAFDDLLAGQPPYFSPIGPARTSSNDRSRSKSPAVTALYSDLKLSRLQAPVLYAEPPPSRSAVAGRSIKAVRSEAQATLTPNRYGVRSLEHSKYPQAADLTAQYRKQPNCAASALQSERAQNAILQQRIDLLCDRDLYERYQTQIEDLQRERQGLAGEIATLKRQLAEREKAVENVTKPDQYGVSLIDKLHQEIRFLNRENLSLKKQLKEARQMNQRYEKREIGYNMQIPEFFYKLTGERATGVEDAVYKFARMQETAIQQRIYNEELVEQVRRGVEECEKFRSERETALRTLENGKYRYEAALDAERARTKYLERYLSQFSVDYEQLIREYKSVVVAADQSTHREDESSFDFDTLQG